MTNQPKIYAPVNAKAVETRFGEIIKLSGKRDDLIKFIEDNSKPDGWINLCVAKRKQPSEKGYTHSVSLDTWEPKPRAGQQAAQSGFKEAHKAAEQASEQTANNKDEVPF